jgi:hypothetical protein
MGEQSLTSGVAGSASRRNDPVRYDVEQATRPPSSTSLRNVANSLFRKILHVSRLDPKFYRRSLGLCHRQVLYFQYFYRYSSNKINAAAREDRRSNSLFWNILRASLLFTRFCGGQYDQLAANPFRKKILQNSAQKNVSLRRTRQFLRLAMFSATRSAH